MFNLFKKSTIRVQFIDANTQEKIGIADMKEEQLPLSFIKPTTMHLKNEEWQVVKAEPEDAFQFKETKQLTLWLSKFEHIDPNKIRFSIPTISNETPQLTTGNIASDFEITLHEDDWRQIELLPLTLLPTIQEEMSAVEAILFPDDETETKNGFDKIHVRTKIGTSHLNISFDEFCNVINASQKGTVKIASVEGTGYVQNGFAIKSANYIYYGTLKNDFIKEMCLQSFESMDDEMSLVCSKYNLVMVVWCEGQITTV
jgi:hypothetical protein